MLEKIQKAGFGRSPPRSTPNIAVTSGSSPTKTTDVRRSDALKRQRCQQRKANHYAKSHHRQRDYIGALGSALTEESEAWVAPRSAAITARADVRKSGVKPPTATRVAGSEPLNMITPQEAAAPSMP